MARLVSHLYTGVNEYETRLHGKKVFDQSGQDRYYSHFSFYLEYIIIVCWFKIMMHSISGLMGYLNPPSHATIRFRQPVCFPTHNANDSSSLPARAGPQRHGELRRIHQHGTSCDWSLLQNFTIWRNFEVCAKPFWREKNKTEIFATIILVFLLDLKSYDGVAL